MPTKNKELQRAYIRAHYQKNKAYYLAKSKEGKERVRKYVRSLKNVPCTDCKKCYPYYVMDFDHKPEFQKKYKLTQIHAYASMPRVNEEVAKCDVVAQFATAFARSLD